MLLSIENLREFFHLYVVKLQQTKPIKPNSLVVEIKIICLPTICAIKLGIKSRFFVLRSIDVKLPSRLIVSGG